MLEGLALSRARSTYRGTLCGVGEGDGAGEEVAIPTDPPGRAPYALPVPAPPGCRTRYPRAGAELEFPPLLIVLADENEASPPRTRRWHYHPPQAPVVRPSQLDLAQTHQRQAAASDCGHQRTAGDNSPLWIADPHMKTDLYALNENMCP